LLQLDKYNWIFGYCHLTIDKIWRRSNARLRCHCLAIWFWHILLGDEWLQEVRAVERMWAPERWQRGEQTKIGRSLSDFWLLRGQWPQVENNGNRQTQSHPKCISHVIDFFLDKTDPSYTTWIPVKDSRLRFKPMIFRTKIIYYCH
jgi:hypothetical protein